jgi:cytochrome P450
MNTTQLTDPNFFATGDPYALWKQLREHAALAWTPEPDGPGLWSVTRFEDGVRVYKDAASFSVRAGTTLEGNRWEDDPGGDKMLALMDAPRHTEMRRLLAPHFTPRRVAEMEQGVRRHVRLLVSRATEMGRFDFMQEVASRLPVSVFFTLMDIPQSDWEHLSAIIFRTVWANEVERYVADSELLMYLGALVAERRRRPGTDLLSAIAGATLDGQLLDDEELVLSSANMLSAGIQTTRLSSGGGVQALMQHPEQWAYLSERPQDVDAAVEEIVRWTSPPLANCRTALVDTELGGQPIGRGQRVVLWLPSFNRDERALPGADHFDIARLPLRHVGFGSGVHACLCMWFARLELRVLLQEIVSAWCRVEADGPTTRLCSLVMHGVDSLPVRVQPRERAGAAGEAVPLSAAGELA